jgi:GntR family transcriptional regulator
VKGPATWGNDILIGGRLILAAALELDPDETVIQRLRRFVLDGKPVLLAVSYLPSKIAKGTPIAQENAGPGGIYARLRDLGQAPVRFREDLRARMPSALTTNVHRVTRP